MKKIKFLTSIPALSLLSASLLPITSCNKTVHVEGVEFNDYYAYVEVGKTINAPSIKIYPSNASNKDVTWKVTDESIASVDNDGKITGLKEGDTYISVFTKDQDRTSYIPLYVRNEYVANEHITVNKRVITLVKGQKTYVQGRVLPENASIQNVVYTCPSTKVAKVDSLTGEITALKAGTCYVYSCSIEDENIYATTEVIVTNSAIAAESVEVFSDNMKMSAGQSMYLPYKISPSNATVKDVKLTSSDESIIKVGSDGYITAVANGSANITIEVTQSASGAQSISKVVTISVQDIEKHIEQISLDKTEINIKTDETSQLSVTFSPEDASYKDVWWYSESESIATVNGRTGEVKGVHSGIVNIYAVSMDGNKYAKCVVNVKQPIEEINLDIPTSLYLDTEEGYNTVNISKYVSVEPFDADMQDIIYSSSDPTKATIDQDGTIVAIAAGDTAITLKSKDDESVCVQKTLHVLHPEHRIASAKLGDGETLINQNYGAVADVDIHCTLTGEDGAEPTYKNMYWYSTNEDVATVTWDENNSTTCTVSPKSSVAGSADIYGITYEGLHIVKSQINIIKLPTSVAITEETKEEASHIASGTSISLDCIVEPDDATNKNVTWTSSDESVARVLSNRELLGVKPGTITLTVKSDAVPTLTDSIEITVTEPIHLESIEFEKSELVIPKYGSEKTNIIYKPTDATFRSVVYESSNENVATVNEHGVVKGTGTGSCTITATSVDGGHKTTCNVIVTTSFSDDTWTNVIKYANEGIDKLKEIYKIDNFIGLTRTLNIGGVNHLVRVIGVNHDHKTDGTTATLTFETAQLVAGSRKFIPSCWNKDANTDNFVESTLNHNLNGGQHQVLSKSMLALIQESEPEVAENIKPVMKDVLVNSTSSNFTVTSYTTKLFPLSNIEYGKEKQYLTSDVVYEYYEDAPAKQRVKVSPHGEIGWYWTRSPINSEHADQINNDGNFSSDYNKVTVEDRVVFAFCI